VPSHPIALELIREAGVPLAAPSANRFAGLSPTTAEHVRAAFGDAVPVIDGGPCEVGLESTVVTLEGGELKLLRPGMISFGDLETSAMPDGAHPSPGMHARHYSPSTRLLLVDSPGDLPDAAGAYVWWRAPANAARVVQMPADPSTYAARLYGVLHELDSAGLPWIAVERPPAGLLWTAVHDRLSRASER
jgi:L-threonylcarbamoyladenylate synthase